MKSIRIKIYTLFLTLAIAGLFNSAAYADDRPNILFIAIDDMKPLIGAYGNMDIKTPTLDSIAAQGMVFTKAYAQYPVCGPSRASLLTGLRPESNGVLNLKTRMRDVYPDILTLPQHFKNNGYETAAVGKIFDPRNVDSRATDDPASWSIAFKATRGNVDSKNNERLAVKSIVAPTEEFIDGAINKRGIELLKSMSAGDNPFFLGIGYKKPHLPFIAPQKYFDLYDRESFILESDQHAPKDSIAKYIMNNNGELRGYAPTPKDGAEVVKYGEGVLPQGQQRELLHGYYAAVSFIDSLIKDVLDTLVETGKDKNTIIVIWGDHGFHLGDHGLWGKHTTMEQATRVPLIIKVPDGTPGTATAPVELMDLFPTLSELAGLQVPDNLQGQSLVPTLTDPSHDQSGVAISQYKRAGAYGYTMRTERYRYTEWVLESGKVVYRDLYDLDNDPRELVNISTLPENATLMEEMAKLLRENGTGLKRLK